LGDDIDGDDFDDGDNGPLVRPRDDDNDVDDDGNGDNGPPLTLRRLSTDDAGENGANELSSSLLSLVSPLSFDGCCCCCCSFSSFVTLERFALPLLLLFVDAGTEAARRRGGDGNGGGDGDGDAILSSSLSLSLSLSMSFLSLEAVTLLSS
jgi:hypothetical protein